MFESLIGLVAIIALFVIISRQQSRIGLIERELGALRSLVLSGVVPPVVRLSDQEAAEGKAHTSSVAAPAADIVPAAISDPAPAMVQDMEVEIPAGESVPGPWSAPEAAPETPEVVPAAAAQAARQSDVETALGTRW
ncbi:DUF2339 domain-containing protein, partial [Mesorhizobium sp. M8A.F.Ca.ET.023.01.1.1]